MRGAGNTIYMSKLAISVKRVLPTAALAAIIVLLIGLAFLPSVRDVNTATVANSARSTDSAAVDVFEKCAEYASEHGFTTKLTGNVKASVLGVPYNVKVRGGREVNGDEFCDVTEGISALVKFGQKKQYAGGEYTVSRGTYKDKQFTYADPTPIAHDSYVDSYGMPPTGLVRYVTDGTIISAEQVDENTFVYTLDAARATEYYRREGRTVLNCDECPTYKSITLTLVTDGERAIKITADEKIRVPKFGGIDCTATFTEVYSY